MSIISESGFYKLIKTKSAPLPERLSEQLTCCTKNKYEQWNYISQVTKRHNCRITGKTKATGGGRQWENTKHKPKYHSGLLTGGQSVRFAPMTPGLTEGHYGEYSDLLVGYSCSLTSPFCDVFQVCDPIFVRLYSLRNFSRTNAHGANLSCSCSLTAFLRCFFLDEDNFFNDLSVIVDTCNPVRHSSPHHGAGDGYSCSLALRRWRRLISSRIFLGKKPAGLFSGRESLLSVCFSVIHQPLGSMPRRFSSARPNSLSQLARLMPSLCASLSNCSFSSGEIRILNCGDCPSPLGLLSRLIVDKWSPIKLTFSLLGDHLNTEALKKAKPEGARNTNGLLTTNDSKIIEVAMRNHTTHPQGRDSHNLNKYIWRFIALSTAQPRVITIEATSEQEARLLSPDGCVMVFAARIRQEVRHVQ
ncbi:TPA: host cell division inhibitor Icd-like protein [Escherichia coli]|nr:host cell division inhibitor Icd-like protein [Escherichia coli]